MDPVVVAVGLGVVAAIPTVIGALTKRSIDALDKSIASLGERVEALGGSHTKLLVEIERLKGRVRLLEHMAGQKGADEP